LRDAQDELESASILFEHGKYRGTCYHSQQCVEKGLKSLILEKGERPERIHDIVEILNKTTKLGWSLSFPMDDAIFLNSIYKGRYPTEEGLLPYGEPTKEDAEKALMAAQNLIKRVQELIE
jgi:HEPN domain-containing protein